MHPFILSLYPLVPLAVIRSLPWRVRGLSTMCHPRTLPSLRHESSLDVGGDGVTEQSSAFSIPSETRSDNVFSPASPRAPCSCAHSGRGSIKLLKASTLHHHRPRLHKHSSPPLDDWPPKWQTVIRNQAPRVSSQGKPAERDQTMRAGV
ncbi:hypothetical protein B0H12DRAFT_100963 [Mycena haematopus]|nr:hypothetical protein B0H12DRAFT_100963 [Mycena haematopus]